MPLVPLDNNVWTEIATTTATTTVQNRGARPIRLTTDDTTDLPINTGWELLPGEAFTFEAGVDVAGSSTEVDGLVYYGDIGVAEA
jgi:hypothetical protein